MDSSTEQAAPHTFSQVVFTNIPQSYPPSTQINCSYTLNPAFKPQSRDWVGIFKVGWSSTKDYHTFVWVELHHDVDGEITRQAMFKDYYLPKDEIEFYQFCYVDSGGQVRGASTPFCFRSPAGQSMESSAEDDLLVITTQEQVDQSVREKAELQKEIDALKAENENLKRSLSQQQRETSSFQSEQREAAQIELAKKMDQFKQENEKLQNQLQENLKENDNLKEILQAKQHETTEESQNLTSLRKIEEKYDQAVMKIKQLKEERDNLKENAAAQDEEITKLKAKVREGERELSKTRDILQLLQVDFQSTVKETEKLYGELQNLRDRTQIFDQVERENRELVRRLSEPVQNPAENDLTEQCQSLSRKLQDREEKLAREREEARDAKRQVDMLCENLTRAKEEMERTATMLEQEQQKNSKYEMQCQQMNEMMADKEIHFDEQEQRLLLMTREKEELTRENSELKEDIEGLRQVYATSNATPPPADSLYLEPDPIPPAEDPFLTQSQQEIPRNSDHLYETIDSFIQRSQEEEESLVCRHCQESFPGITQDELEQHEQSHRVCPFCTMICDHMEQSVFEDHVYGHEL